MPQLAIAAVSAISFTAAGALTFSVSTFALNAALGFALMALTPKNQGASAGSAYSGESVDSAAPQQIIYGRTKVGGVRVYTQETENSKYLHKIVAFAGHTIQSYDEIYLNDELVSFNSTTGIVTSPAHYSGLVRIKTYLGEPTQSADPSLISESGGLWTANHKLSGIAYIYARFEFSSDAYPNGEPVITAVIKGKKVLDTRTGVTQWSSNPALCLMDYITSKYSIQESASYVDTDLVSAAANICDENVVTNAGTEKRYSCDGAIISSVKPVDGINAILVTMGGTLWFSQGKWRMKASAWVTPVASFDESDLRSGLSISTRNSRRDNFNIVGGKFRGEASKWAEDEYPEYRSNTFISVDGGLESRAEIDLLMVSSSPRAQRLAKLALYRSREQITFSATFSLTALKVQVGDAVYITNTRAGWFAKAFEVQNWTFVLDDSMMLAVKMTLRETSASTYIWNLADESVFESNNTNLSNPFYVEPVGLTVSATTVVIYEKLTNVLTANVTCADASKIKKVEAQFKKSSDTEFRGMGSGPVGKYDAIDVADTTYDVRVRATNYLDVNSEWVTASITVTGFVAAPTDVAMFTANLSGSNVSLTWQASPDLDLSHYIIRHSVEEAGATYANATTAAQKVSRPATSITLPARPGTYHVKAYDKTGNASTNYSSTIVPSAVMPVFGNNPTLVKSSGTNFTGTKTNTDNTSGDLRITSTATLPASGTYEASGYIDTLSARKITCRVDVVTTRYSAASGLWDDMVGLWDSWAGLWDDWTGAVQLSDTNVVCYISITNDDPAGASPVWSAYAPFTAGEFYGRAFRFKLELTSEDTGITPSVSSMTARVSY
jgi:hypothetical protein